jgi:hypothetical protein
MTTTIKIDFRRLKQKTTYASMKLPTASCGVSPGSSFVVAFLYGCTHMQQAAGYSDKIKNSFEP